MSKELEALNKIQHDFGQLKGQELVSCYETIFNALKRLEAIDNANPSEALENLKYLKNLTKVKDILNVPCWNESYEIVEKAILKAQEPKHYLKWEDLEFEENKEIDVLMNGNKYALELRPKDTRMEYLDEVVITNTNTGGVIVLNELEAETFNDLHLERVEE